MQLVVAWIFLAQLFSGQARSLQDDDVEYEASYDDLCSLIIASRDDIPDRVKSHPDPQLETLMRRCESIKRQARQVEARNVDKNTEQAMWDQLCRANEVPPSLMFKCSNSTTTIPTTTTTTTTTTRRRKPRGSSSSDESSSDGSDMEMDKGYYADIGDSGMDEYEYSDEDDCCEDDNCESYSGHLSVSVSGKDCVDWDKALASRSRSLSSRRRSHPILESNYCRNPYGYKTQAWCFTMQDGAPKPEICDMISCSAFRR